MAKKKTLFQKIRNFFLKLFVLLLLAGGGLFAAIHFEVLDRAVVEEKLQWANEKVGLYKLPLVGYGGVFEYFEVPEGVVWPPPEPEPEPETPLDAATVATNRPAPQPAAEPKKSKEVKVSQKDLEEQAKVREAAEKKRISKLARIYDNMKPEEAAKALDNVNIDTVVLILQKMDESNAGKVLAKMESRQAAQITQMLMDGDRRRL